jgi:outer membrane protein assembly factor BamB
MVKSEKYSWKMFRGNVMRTGISSSNLSRTPSLQWMKELGPMIASPVFENSVVYAATMTGRIFALKAYQSEKKLACKYRQPYNILTSNSTRFVNSCHIRFLG